MDFTGKRDNYPKADEIDGLRLIPLSEGIFKKTYIHFKALLKHYKKDGNRPRKPKKYTILEKIKPVSEKTLSEKSSVFSLSVRSQGWDENLENLDSYDPANPKHLQNFVDNIKRSERALR